MRMYSIAVRRASALFAAVLSINTLGSSAANAAPIALRALPTRSVTTLLFHQISDRPIHSTHGEDNIEQPWLSPSQFDAILSDLERRGYTVVSLDYALSLLAARDANADSAVRTKPAKPVLLTFDDGFESARTIATPILRKHHAKATMFFEGKVTGTQADRLGLEDLRALRASNIWQFASHGWAGHSPLPISAGTTSPYWYANLMWLSAENRLETLAEFEARIRADLRHFRATFEPLLQTKFDVFAYPSGEFGQNDALADGGNPATREYAGHSNSHDIKSALSRVLSSEGVRAAFAVDIPGAVHAASAQDGPYQFPRIGVGAHFDPAILDSVASDGIELPEITSDDTFADCLAIANTNGDYFVASNRRPEIYHLSHDGRLRDTYAIPSLLDDRSGRPTLVSALVSHGDDVTILQQAGWWPGARAYITQIHFAHNRPVVDGREPLPPALNWNVGAIERDGKILAMTDEGRFYDVANARGAPLFSVALAGGSRHERFAGPTVINGRTFVYDRALALLEEIDATGDVIATGTLRGDVRALASRGKSELIAVDWTAKRRVALRFRLADG
ncbi:MAG: hypothetical protein NVS1B2_09760 [Vulcanimicrobiaceae bacterium]